MQQRPDTTGPHRAPGVLIHTYGCQMNKLDSEIVCEALVRAGYRLVEDEAEADVVLFNTCSVRDHAEQRVFSNVGALKRLKRRNPELIVGVMGCMAQRLGREIIRRAPVVDLVCGTRMFPHIARLLDRAAVAPVVAVDEDPLPDLAREGRERAAPHAAFVSIMRGCDNFCAYCVVPYLRGRETSRPPDEIEAEVRRLVDDGCREITLLGQNVDTYGKRLSPVVTLAALLHRLDGIDGLARLRFVTSHPRFISRELLEAVRDLSSVCEHVHMPAQSGSTAVLTAMKRGYTREEYLDVIAMARELVPGIAIASDFIVGFPGETEADFDRTADLFERVRFQQCFIFKYSEREGTAAAELPDDVPDAEKRRRNQALLAIQQRISAEDNAAFVGRTVKVPADGPSKSDARKLSGRLRTNQSTQV